jgi:hypothetical protein
MSDECWGPWIEHRPGPRPVPAGTILHYVCHDGSEVIGAIGTIGRLDSRGREITTGGRSWWWIAPYSRIVRYRIRKPRGATILEEIAKGIRVPEEA